MRIDEVTPEWLTFALSEGGYLKSAVVQSVEKKIIGEAKGFLSSVVRVTINYDKDESSAPRSVVIKLQPEEGEFKDFGDQTNAFQREIRFYQEVAGNVSIRLPKLYYAVDEPPAYSIVMEDLFHYVPGDQLRGMHSAQVKKTVEEIAVLQAKYWDNEELEKLDWMPEFNGVGIDYVEKWPSFIKHYGFCLDDRGVELGTKLARHIDWKKEEMQSRPKTIVHFDLREDNLMFPPDGEDGPILILDWQLTLRNIGAIDIFRLMAGSEVPMERKGHEFEVLKKWHDTLIEEGVSNYFWDEAVYDLRLGALSFLCNPVTFHSAALKTTGRAQELARAIFTRSFASAVEIDAGSILPEQT